MDEYDGRASTLNALGLLSFLLLATVAFFWFVRGEATADAGASAPSHR